MESHLAFTDAKSTAMWWRFGAKFGMSTKPSRQPRPSNRLPKNLYAVLDGDLSSLHATVGDLSRQIGSGRHATKKAARGAKGTAGKRLESQNLPFEGKP